MGASIHSACIRCSAHADHNELHLRIGAYAAELTDKEDGKCLRSHTLRRPSRSEQRKTEIHGGHHASIPAVDAYSRHPIEPRGRLTVVCRCRLSQHRLVTTANASTANHRPACPDADILRSVYALERRCEQRG